MGNLAGGVGHDSQYPHVAECHHHLARAGVERVADQHRHLVAEQCVRRASPAPELRVVDDVVVQQRRGVDELDDDRQLDVPVAFAAERTGGEQHQQRSQPLAPAPDDVLGDLVHEVDVRRETVPNGAIDGREVVVDKGSNRGEIAKRRRRRSGKHGQCRSRPHERLPREYSPSTSGPVGAHARRRRAAEPGVSAKLYRSARNTYNLLLSARGLRAWNGAMRCTR